MTPTSANAKRRTARGLTLLELLIALAILALIASISIASIRSSSPRLAVKLASEQLLADVKHARREASARNVPITIHIDARSYAIEALAINRELPGGMNVQLTGGDGENIIIDPGVWLRDYEIVLSKGPAQAVLTLEALTKRTTLQ